MNPAELAFGAVVVPLLLALAGFFAWRQKQTLQALRTQEKLEPDERRYLRTQAWRRLLCCVLMVVLAGLLASSWFLESPRLEVSEEVRGLPQGQVPTAEQKTFVQQFTLYWMGILGILFVLLMLVAVDVWAIARFGARQHRKLRDDYRAVLQSEIARLRGKPNGSSQSG